MFLSSSASQARRLPRWGRLQITRPPEITATDSTEKEARLAACLARFPSGGAAAVVRTAKRAGRQKSRGSPVLRRSAAAAVAGDDQGEDNEPDPVVVKQVAQAVVHNRIPPCRLAGTLGTFPLLSEYVERGKMFRKKVGLRRKRAAREKGAGET